MGALLDALGQCRRVAVVGLAKNAGKTTTLNALVAQAADARLTVGLCSIGRDGEREDILTRLPKPAVTVPAGSYCVTTDRFADGLELIEPLDSAGVLGSPGVYRCPDGCGPPGRTVDLVGVNRTSVVRRALAILENRADTVFVDGAFDRRSSGMPRLTDGVVLATGGAVGNSLSLIAERTAHVVRLIHLPICEPGRGRRTGLAADEREACAAGACPVRVPGALTFRRSQAYAAARRTRRVGCFHVHDWTRVFLDEREFADLYASGWTICCETGSPLLAVTTSPFSPDGPRLDGGALLDAVRARLSQDGFAVPCFDVRVGGRPG